MEPLSALGIAASIVQFVDFAARLLSDANEIIHSANGMTAKHERIDDVYKKLNELNQSLGDAASSCPRALRELLPRSKAECDAILAAVHDTVVTNGKGKAWRSVKASFKNTLGAKKIAELEAEIKETQTAISSHVQDFIRLRVIGLGEALRLLSQESQVLGVKHSSQLDTIAHGIQSLNDHIKEQQLTTAEKLQKFEERLLKMSSAEAEAKQTHALLSSLTFKSQPTRHEAIPFAYNKTFEWIHESNFAEWLRDDSSVFWITGKAGSGKSTLMKYIAGHEKTQASLQQWARPQKAVMSAHYFWSAGTEMQKSQHGLLRTLLLQIFRQEPSLMPEACPDRWKEPDTNDVAHAPWTISDLAGALDKIGTIQNSPVRICIFVDGLDEFAGDHYELCKTLKEFSQHPGIKLCVSSRPWNVFEDFFGDNSSTRLAIHEKTADDIRIFARGRLEEHPRWQDWSLVDRGNLIDGIVKRAQGVFLWAFLVTRSLREGLSNDDSIADLEIRLNGLPSDLENLFKHMLDRVEKMYHPKSASTLQIALRAQSPLGWEIYHWHDQDNGTRKFYTNNPQPQTSSLAVSYSSQLRQTRRRLNAYTQGLLEIPEDRNPVIPIPMAGEAGPRVEFLHRTVRDFLDTEEMDRFISAKLSPEFEAHTFISRAFVACYKTIDFSVWGNPQGILAELLMEFFSYTSHIPESHQNDMIGLVDEMERSCMAEARNSGVSPKRFFRTAVLRHAPPAYLSAKLHRRPNYLAIFKQPALCAATFMVDAPLGILEVLLEHGHNPNEKSPGGSPWSFLVWKHREWPDFNNALLSGLFSRFLAHGADPNANVAAEGQNRLSVFAIFLLSFFRHVIEKEPRLRLDLYVGALRDFIRAGANLDSKIGGLAIENSRRGPDSVTLNYSSTIKQEFKRTLGGSYFDALPEEHRSDILDVIECLSAEGDEETRRFAERCKNLAEAEIERIEAIEAIEAMEETEEEMEAKMEAEMEERRMRASKWFL